MKVFCRPAHLLILLAFAAAGCQRTLNWDLQAKGTLKDPQGTCYPSTLHGSFSEGKAPAGDTSYLEVTVNVFSPGTYLISTDLQNGLIFSGSGSFGSTGIQQVRLRPAGTPVRPGRSDFIVRFDTSACPLSVMVKDTTSTKDTLNTWRYTDVQSKRLFHGIINATHVVVTPLSTLVSLRHEITNPLDTSFDVSISFPNGIVPGTYTTDIINNFALSSRGICINCAWNVAFQLYGALTTIVVQSYDPQSKIIKGSFSGTSIDGDNNVLAVKNGAFYAVIR